MKDRIENLLATVFGGIFLALSVVVTVETLSRKLFNVSLQGADELGGYALAVGPDGRAVRDAAMLAPGDGLRLEFARGEAETTVTRVVAAPKGQ